MSFLMDMVSNSNGDSNEEHYGASLLACSSHEGIELPAVGNSNGVWEDQTAQTPQLLASRSKNRLTTVGTTLLMAVLCVMGLSTIRNRKEKGTFLASTMNTAASVAMKPKFTKPNVTQYSSHSLEENTFLPSYTLQSIVKSPYSPQGLALAWVEAYPHFRNMRKWRQKQLMALATFYYSTGGNFYWNASAKTDWLTTNLHECNWKGDKIFYPDCTKRGLKGRYQRLHMTPSTLMGTVPPELAMLTGLFSLDLNTNPQLHGTIPTQMGKMTLLAELSLYDNRLEGSIPSELGRLSKLFVLNMDHNFLVGSLPSELGRMTNLKRLALRNNRLTGTIPSVLKKLSNLESLYLEGNRLNGTVSPGICYFPRLSEIWVDCSTVKCPCAQCICAEEYGEPEEEEGLSQQVVEETFVDDGSDSEDEEADADQDP